MIATDCIWNPSEIHTSPCVMRPVCEYDVSKEIMARDVICQEKRGNVCYIDARADALTIYSNSHIRIDTSLVNIFFTNCVFHLVLCGDVG